MNRFRMKAIAEGDEGLCSIWLVVADNMFDAVNLIPAGHLVESMAIHLDPTRGPARILGTIALPSSDGHSPVTWCRTTAPRSDRVLAKNVEPRQFDEAGYDEEGDFWWGRCDRGPCQQARFSVR